MADHQPSGNLSFMTDWAGQKKLAGSGRILFWNGGSIWIGNAEAPTEPHAHHAIQLSLVLSDGVMTLSNVTEELKDLRCAVIRSNYLHSFAAKGELVAQIFVDPESTEGLALRALFKAGISMFDEKTITLSRAELKAAYLDDDGDEQIISRAKAVVRDLAATNKADGVGFDTRITKAVSVMRSNLSQSIMLSDVARHVSLSPDRFRHLFIEQTGIRFRQYVLWLRLCASASSYSSGSTLTDAALIGGFADAAHFTRTFKRMFGIAPIRIKIVRIES
jgi:AraC family transcriptional regulator